MSKPLAPSASSTRDTETIPSPEALALHGRTFRRTLFSGWFGTALEYLDFQLYSLAAALVFNHVFFPHASTGVSLLASFATYGVGFLARPLGAVYFGRMGDRLGRKRTLMITISLMGVSTTLIGALPPATAVGALAPALLVVLRIVQGFGAGAELSGASVLLAEAAPAPRRGFLSGLIALGTTLGNVAASGTWLLVVSTLSDDDLYSWGWRLPFLFSLLIMLMTLWMRRNMAESPVFRAVVEPQVDQDDADEATAVSATAELTDRSFWSRSFLFVVLLRFGESGNSQIFQGFLLGYAASVLGMSKSIGTLALLISSVAAFATVPLVGTLSDRIGRRWTYRLIAGFQILLAFPALASLQSGAPVALIVVILLGNAVGSLGMFATQSAYAAELLGSRRRYQQLAVAKEIGAIASGGVASFIASGLLILFDDAWWPIAALIAVYSLVAFVTTFAAPETRGRDLSLPSAAA